MGSQVRLRLSLWVTVLFCLALTSASVCSEEPPWSTEPPPPSSAGMERSLTASREGSAPVVEATIIDPFQAANVGAEVSGIIQAIHYNEGDKLTEGEVVAEIKKDSYKVDATMTGEKEKYLRAVVQMAEAEAKAREELLEMQSATRLEVLRAKQQLENMRAELSTAKKEHLRALRDLDACDVKAPFSGYMSARLKQPFETLRSLEPIFSIVDSEKVFAVAYLPEELLERLNKGDEAIFRHRSGKEYRGRVNRIGKLLDPKTKTKKVYILIENPDNLIEVGMTGSLELPTLEGEPKSQN
jgi:RND family efflux transporter MFP subunit